MYKNHVISTNNEVLTSRFRPPNRPDHNGADYIDGRDLQITPKGVDVTALADGKAVELFKDDSRGNTVVIAHNGNITTGYQHLRDGVAVKIGDAVKKSQKIGVMGNTGSCVSSRMDVPIEYRGTHLHLFVKINSTSVKNGEYVNPEPSCVCQTVFDTQPLSVFRFFLRFPYLQFISLFTLCQGFRTCLSYSTKYCKSYVFKHWHLSKAVSRYNDGAIGAQLTALSIVL
jgi:murein DD-endopeptidase MepM/ murein hydrolase activator NlpD